VHSWVQKGLGVLVVTMKDFELGCSSYFASCQVSGLADCQLRPLPLDVSGA
jgi:hypothetical protein